MRTLPPSDFYQVATPTAKFNVEAGTTNTILGELWCTGYEISQILSRIIVDNSYNPGKPTLVLSGSNILQFYNASSANCYVEFAICTFVKDVTATTSDLAGYFTNLWDYSYSTHDTNFPYFPTTHLFQNWAFFNPQILGIKCVRRMRFKIPAASLKQIRTKHRPVAFKWLDYKEIAALGPSSDNLYFRFKSFFYVARFKFETGLVCGTTTQTPAPTSGIWQTIANVGGDIAVKNLQFMRYNWVAGNVAPHQYGNWLSRFSPGSGGNENIPGGTNMGWVRDGRNKNFRYVYTNDQASSNNFVTWGPNAVNSIGVPFNNTNAVDINPVQDCAGDTVKQQVHNV